MTQLTEHISLEDMLHSESGERLGIDNTPDAVALENLHLIASVMEVIRLRLGCPLVIYSGYRSTAVNAVVGGVATSAHCHGLACDFVFPEYGSPYMVAIAITPWIKELCVDQLIREYGWIHVGLAVAVAPRNELLTKRSAAAKYELGILA
jgi:hypothetical protein